MSLASNKLSFFKNALRLDSLIGGRRWLRRTRPEPGKPPILPPSKQMLYRIVNGDWEEPKYVKELLWRRHVYNNAMISIQKLFREENHVRESAGLGIENLKKQEQLELNALIEENEKRNAERADSRKKRYEEHLKSFQEDVIKEVQNILNIEASEIEKRNEEVLKHIEESDNYITIENLKSKIEEALENPIVYDFAIDLSGKRFYSSPPVKYQEGQPTRQKSRMYDISHSKII